MTTTPVTMRKAPRKRLFQEDQLPKYAEIDPVIHNLKELEVIAQLDLPRG